MKTSIESCHACGKKPKLENAEGKFFRYTCRCGVQSMAWHTAGLALSNWNDRQQTSPKKAKR